MNNLWLAAAAASVVTSGPLAPASSDLNDYNVSTNAAETVMVLARSDADFRNARIFIAERGDAGWSEPRPIAFTDSDYNDSDPWLTPDGQTIYFISDRPAPGREAGRSDYDIWRAERTTSGWSAPEHLGAAVNSKGQELGPEVHGGRLYFASARRSGLGGLDIYSASADGDMFGLATLLEGPFNSAASDSDFTLSADGSAALFWRSVAGAGMLHIAYRSPAGRWLDPVMLGPEINIGPFNFTPSFADDDAAIRFASTRARAGQPDGYADIYEMPLPDLRSVHRAKGSR